MSKNIFRKKKQNIQEIEIIKNWQPLFWGRCNFLLKNERQGTVQRLALDAASIQTGKSEKSTTIYLAADQFPSQEWTTRHCQEASLGRSFNARRNIQAGKILFFQIQFCDNLGRKTCRKNNSADTGAQKLSFKPQNGVLSTTIWKNLIFQSFLDPKLWPVEVKVHSTPINALSMGGLPKLIIKTCKSTSTSSNVHGSFTKHWRSHSHS